MRQLRKLYKIPWPLAGVFSPLAVDALRRTFAEFDKDLNESVNFKELTALFASMGYNFSKFKIAVMIVKVDASRDYAIDFGEVNMNRTPNILRDHLLPCIPFLTEAFTSFLFDSLTAALQFLYMIHKSRNRKRHGTKDLAELSWEVEAKANLAHGQVISYFF